MMTISPPLAVDAQGRSQPSSYEIEGDTLVIKTPHRGREVAYPEVVDPEFTVKEDWACAGSANCTATWFHGNGSALGGLGQWSFYTDYNNVAGYEGNTFAGRKSCFRAGWFNSCYRPAHGGPSPQDTSQPDGLHVLTRPNFYYPSGKIGEWVYQPPGNSTQIARADFGAKFLRASGRGNPFMFTGIYSYTDWNWVQIQSFSSDVTHGWNAHFGASRPGPQAVGFGFFAYGNAYYNQWRDAYMGAAIISLTDPDAPAINTMGMTGPTGWTKDATFTFAPSASDNGLGIRRFRFSAPGQADQDRWVWCNGAKSAPCLQTFALNAAKPAGDPYAPFRINAANLPEGEQNITIKASDALAGPGHDTSQSTTVKIDRSAPSVSIAGISEGELLRSRSYDVSASVSDQLSGSKSIRLTLDGTELIPTKNCPGTTAPCSVQVSIDGGDSSLTEGSHQLVATGVDQAGNSQTQTRSFRVDRTAPTLDLAGSLKPPEGPWVAKGEQELLYDASDNGSGVTHAELLIDDKVIGTADQDCPAGACDLSHDFYVSTDDYAAGEHTLKVRARDGAGQTREQSWTIRVERDSPSLTLGGTLPDFAGQPLDGDRTYTVIGSATDSGGTPQPSGLGSLRLEVDDDEVESFSQGCQSGGCPQSHSFDVLGESIESGNHTVAVVATDLAGNETRREIQVNSGDVAASCASTSEPATTDQGSGADPSAARAMLESNVPQALAPSSLQILLDEAVRPTLSNVDGTLRGQGLLGDVDLSYAPAAGLTQTLHTEGSPSCTRPTEVNRSASAADPVESSGLFLANTAKDLDTLVRPVGLGVASVFQVRSANAPNALSWSVGLQPGQELKLLPSGEVAVIEPAPPGAVTPGEGEPLPSLPTSQQRERGLSDTGAGMEQANDDLNRAQHSDPGKVISVLSKPWARDTTGASVPTSWAVSGSTVTLTMAPQSGTSFPLAVGTTMVSRDAVSEYQNRRAAEDTSDDAAQAPDEEPPDQPTTPTAGTPSTTPAPDDTDGQSALDENDVVPGADDGSPDMTGTGGQAMASSLSKLKAGITAADPNTIIHPLYRGTNSDARKRPLNPSFVRPFAPWNVERINDNTRSRGAKTKAALWREWAVNAANNGIRGDVAITRDETPGRKGTSNFMPSDYGRALRAFTSRYGREVDAQGQVVRQGVIDNLMAWNEPDYEGTGLSNGDGVDNGDPLKRDPVRVAGLYAQARSACFPRGEPARCGHLRDGKFVPGEIVAGEFVGRPKGGDRIITVRDPGKRRRVRKTFTKAYHDVIARLGPTRQPRVWSFHDYGDAKAYLLFRGRDKIAAPVIKRFYAMYRSTDPDGKVGDYRYKQDGQLRRPQIWMTEGGAPYHYGCGEIPKKVRKDLCDTGVNVVLFGMGKELGGAGFLLRELAKRNITRYYNFGFRSSERDKCKPPKPNVFTCQPKDTALVGKSDDAVYRSSDPDVKKQIKNLSGGNDDTSLDDERRRVFCLLRDRKRDEVLKPTIRLTRAKCPG